MVDWLELQISSDSSEIRVPGAPEDSRGFPGGPWLGCLKEVEVGEDFEVYGCSSFPGRKNNPASTLARLAGRSPS